MAPGWACPAPSSPSSKTTSRRTAPCSCPKSCAPTWAASASQKRGESQMSQTVIKPPSPKQRDTGTRPRRWTRQEYYRAAECGVFQPGERLELLDGEILQKMSPQRPPHATGVALTAHALDKAFGQDYYV